MNKSIKQLALISLLSLSSFGLVANPNTEQNDSQTDEQAAEQTIMVPVINPNTGKIELYTKCETVPHCDDVVVADLVAEDDND